MIAIVIIFEGPISSGKSTYTERLSEQLETKPFYESVDDNPILDKYYEDPEKYAFALQIYFLNTRFKAIKEAYKENNNVLDRSIYADALFTKNNVDQGNISYEEYQIYLDLLDNMMEEIHGLPYKKSPDLLIYLDTTFNKTLDNIEKRGRDYEQVSDENPELKDYYSDLYDKYNVWYDGYNESPKMKLNVNGLDINKEEDWEKVWKLVKAKLEELGLI